VKQLAESMEALEQREFNFKFTFFCIFVAAAISSTFWYFGRDVSFDLRLYQNSIDAAIDTFDYTLFSNELRNLKFVFSKIPELLLTRDPIISFI
jgi:hypothetical protein